MTYQKILDLKFKKKIPTLTLQKIFRKAYEKVRQVALTELPSKTLRKLIRNERKLEELLSLKKSLKARGLYS